MGRGELGLLIHWHNKEAAAFYFYFSLKDALGKGVVKEIPFSSYVLQNSEAVKLQE